MEENRSAEGVEHLQAAARELLLAARSFLDVVEEVVEDRDRLAGAASGVVDLLRDGLAGAIPASSPLEPWERAAWSGAEPDEPEATSTGPSVEEPAAEAAARGGATAAKKAPAKKAPARKAAPTAASDGPRRRVRRIAVD